MRDKPMSIPYFLMGFISLILQVIAVRELLTQFSGNELVIGITISVWLIIVGAGSFMVGNYGPCLPQIWQGSTAPFGATFIFLGLLATPSVFLMGSIRQFISITPGETISLHATILLTFLCLLLPCLIIGIQFPLAVRCARGTNPSGTVYAIEAGGAFAGGIVFTFFLSGKIDTMTIALSLSLLCLFLSAYILKRKILLMLLIVPAVFYIGIEGFEGKGPGPLLKRVQSRYGEIWVSRLREQFNVYSGGHFAFSYPDRQTEELRAHLAMTLHPDPKEILVVGGSPGTLREFLKYPLKRIDFVEIDPELIKVSTALMDSHDRHMADDKRLAIVVEDGRRFIKKLKSPSYDMVILNLPPPSTASMNRFYTVEFFNEVKGCLRKDGILAMTLPVSAGYVGRRMLVSNGSVYNSLKAVFSNVETTTEEYGGFFASMSLIESNPENLEKRFKDRSIGARHFSSYIFSDALSTMRAGSYKARLGSSSAINTDLKPSAYLYNLLLWAEAHGGRLLFVVFGLKWWKVLLIAGSVLVLTAIAIAKKKNRTLYYSMFTTGYGAMALSLSILLSLQAVEGYVYEMLGLLTGLFMAGIALGAMLSRGIKNPLKGLLVLEAGTVLFSMTLPSLLLSEVFYYILCLMAGTITGCGFSVVSSAIKTQEPQVEGGRLYAIDLLGSFLGALLTAIIFIPLLGIKGSLLTVAMAKAISLVMVAFIYETH